MIESVLQRNNVRLGARVTVKTIISAALIALAAALPQLVHLLAGSGGGMQWLPMYLPVLLGGCLLGWKWGLGVGALSPLVSFFITSLTGNAMPAAARLPYMMAELAVMALTAGMFSKKIDKNLWTAFAAVTLAFVLGRAAFIALAAIFQSVSALSAAAVWAQVQAGLPGMVLQMIAVPLAVMGVGALLHKEKA